MTEKNSLFWTVIILILICLGYLGFSRIGLLFVIPPGQASIIWPAAGLAMASLYVYGYKAAVSIFIAALINSLGFYEDIHFKEIAVSSSIAFGATLQAAVGTYILKQIYKKKRL